MTASPPNHSSHAILSTDAEGRVTAVSADAADVFGRSVEELIGRFVTDFVVPDDVAALAGAYRATLEGGRSTTVRLHIPSEHGPALTFEATAFAIRDAVGRAPALTLSLRRTGDRERASSGETWEDLGSERLQTVVDGAQLGTWDWHVPTGALRFNARWAEMLGYRLDEIAPELSAWERLVHPDDLPAVMEVLREHLEGRREIYSTEHRMLHKDGHTVWIQDVGRVLERDDEGHPIRAAGIHLDITARMTAEAAAQQHLAKFRSLFESQPLGVAVTDPDGNLLEVNQRAEEILGLSMATLASREIGGDEWAILRPDGSPMPPEEFASVVALSEGRCVDGSEMAVRRPDGSWRWISVSAAPVDHPDYGVLISYTDVTEIKTQEARFRAILDSVDDVIFTLDEDRRYAEIFVADRHEAWRETVGQRPQDLIGRHRRELVGDAPHHEDMVARAFAGESVVYEWAPEGATPGRRVQTALSRIVDNAGQVIGVVGVARDITARVQLEEARVEMEKRTMALQKAESLAALAGGVAHDFNNLLSGVLLNAELAANIVGPASRARDLIEDIVSAADSASALSRQMLAYSGGGRILVERIEPGDLLRSMRSSVATRLGAETAIHLDIAEGVPPIQADATQVWQALYNLILNAADALKDEAGDISVEVGAVTLDQIPGALQGDRTHLTGDSFVEFRVVDSGDGIADDITERLFEPFFTTRFSGRGMGLSAVLGITRAHGGAILFDPKTDTGAAFHLYLPAFEGGESAAPLAAAPDAPPAPTVLIVDDEEIVRRAGRRLLETLGYRVLEADDGDVALDMWQAQRGDVDLVILDMTMPRLDGCDTLAQLRECAPDLKVLMTSGYSEREVLARSKDHTPNGFIPKPFRLKQVQESIEGVLAPCEA